MFVRKFNEEDWQAYRSIRLEALSLFENIYGESFKNAASRDDQVWKDILSGERQAVFGLYDGEQLIGTSAVFSNRSDKRGRSALMAGSYIREEYRGQKLSRLLYEARIGWIVNCGYFDRITIGHKKGNEASRRANQAFGFEYTGQEKTTWGDGSEDILMRYERKVA